MKRLQKSALLVLALLAMPLTLLQANEADLKAVQNALKERLPATANSTIKATPINGLYEVMAGGQIMYVTKDARYILDGDLFDMQNRSNLTEQTRGGVRLSALGELGEENMLVYTPKGDVRHTITVFTDIYCPYCRKLHEEMNQYMDNGIKVRYIFVPFKGAKSVDTSVSVWCAKNRNQALDKAKAGEEIEKKTCDNPISKHQQLASTLGIRGTPAIMLESGQLMPGYVPAGELIQRMDGIQ